MIWIRLKSCSISPSDNLSLHRFCNRWYRKTLKKANICWWTTLIYMAGIADWWLKMLIRQWMITFADIENKDPYWRAWEEICPCSCFFLCIYMIKISVIVYQVFVNVCKKPVEQLLLCNTIDYITLKFWRSLLIDE